MKVRVAVALSLLVVVVAMANLFPGRAQEAGTPEQQSAGKGLPVNPLKLALLKWFPAYRSTSFKVGKSPIGLAFDGANIWVSDQYGFSLTELRASDGQNLGSFPVGNGPTGVAFDGANIWTANSFDGTVTKLRASDGKTLGTFSVGFAPLYLAFDGEAMWVTNSGGHRSPSCGRAMGRCWVRSSTAANPRA